LGNTALEKSATQIQEKLENRSSQQEKVENPKNSNKKHLHVFWDNFLMTLYTYFRAPPRITVLISVVQSFP